MEVQDSVLSISAFIEVQIIIMIFMRTFDKYCICKIILKSFIKISNQFVHLGFQKEAAEKYLVDNTHAGILIVFSPGFDLPGSYW